jgi:aminoglycoside phosphotransferase family enzyme/predicted kinase
MIVEDQRQTIAFLLDPNSHDLSGPVERIETHISEIFLIGNKALKLKRAVKLPYADFSTPELRLTFCHREVERNRRTAPGLYRGVQMIVRNDSGRLQFGGEGELVDAVVEMVRFDGQAILDSMAARDAITPRLMRDVADGIAAFHGGLEPVTGMGGFALMNEVLAINESGFATSDVFSGDEIAQLCSDFRLALEKLRTRLDRRSDDGHIRLGHGDLHLRNICMFNDRPTLFDCIEFNDRIATVDVLYDLAFLLMDLWHRGKRDLASLAANRYCDRTGNDDGWSLLPFFMAVRSAVRAHVTATQVAEADSPDDGLIAAARGYFDLARQLLGEARPRLVALGGLSGSGKSTLAEAISPSLGLAPGARILESDRIRKALHGTAPETALPAEAYAPEVSVRVYHEMNQRAEQLLEDGCTVVANAVFANRRQRRAIGEVAGRTSVPFTGIWLEAPPDVLLNRVATRSKTASDADVAVLQKQLAGIGRADDWLLLPVTGLAGETASAALSVILQTGN